MGRKNRRVRGRHLKDKDVVNAYPLEVTIEQCSGNTTKMIKRFSKMVRKEGIFESYYERSRGPKTKGQKRREERASKQWLEKKRLSKIDDDC